MVERLSSRFFLQTVDAHRGDGGDRGDRGDRGDWGNRISNRTDP